MGFGKKYEQIGDDNYGFHDESVCKDNNAISESK